MKHPLPASSFRSLLCGTVDLSSRVVVCAGCDRPTIKRGPHAKLCGECYRGARKAAGVRGGGSAKRKVPREIVCAYCKETRTVTHPRAIYCSEACEKRANHSKETRTPEQMLAKWLAWKEKQEPGYTARYWTRKRAARERREAVSRRKAWRDMYPGAHLPSKADAKRAGALCRTCGNCKPRQGSNYCRACTDYHASAAGSYEVRRRRGDVSPRAWRVGRYQGPADVDKEKAAARFALFGHRCAWCGAKAEALYRDHVLPRAAGGTNHPANIVPACFGCNSSKSAKHPAVFVVMRVRRGLPVTRFARVVMERLTAPERARHPQRGQRKGVSASAWVSSS